MATVTDDPVELSGWGIREPNVRIDRPEARERLQLLAEAGSGGVKYDGDKLRYDLISPVALRALAEVYTFGAHKYADHNWRRGIAFSRVYGALQRHLQAFWAGEDPDPESGLPHLAHAAWNCFALLEYMVTHPELDDRYRSTGDSSE